MLRFFGVAACLACLSGCVSSGPSSYTRSGFETPNGLNETVTIDRELENKYSNTIYDSELDAGAAFIVGTDEDGAAAYSGVMPGSDVGAPVSSGTGTYDAAYRLLAINTIRVIDDTLWGDVETDGGPITLKANFDSGKLTGTDGAFDVDAKITDGKLEGQVRYFITEGDLVGMIGADGLVAAFHGNDVTEVFAGGIVGTRN